MPHAAVANDQPQQGLPGQGRQPGRPVLAGPHARAGAVALCARYVRGLPPRTQVGVWPAEGLLATECCTYSQVPPVALCSALALLLAAAATRPDKEADSALLCRQMLLRKWRDVVEQELQAAHARARRLETRAWLEKGLVLQVHSQPASLGHLQRLTKVAFSLAC